MLESHTSAGSLESLEYGGKRREHVLTTKERGPVGASPKSPGRHLSSTQDTTQQLDQVQRSLLREEGRQDGHMEGGLKVERSRHRGRPWSQGLALRRWSTQLSSVKTSPQCFHQNGC